MKNSTMHELENQFVFIYLFYLYC